MKLYQSKSTRSKYRNRSSHTCTVEESDCMHYCEEESISLAQTNHCTQNISYSIHTKSKHTSPPLTIAMDFGDELPRNPFYVPQSSVNPNRLLSNDDSELTASTELWTFERKFRNYNPWTQKRSNKIEVNNTDLFEDASRLRPVLMHSPKQSHSYGFENEELQGSFNHSYETDEKASQLYYSAEESTSEASSKYSVQSHRGSIILSDYEFKYDAKDQSDHECSYELSSVSTLSTKSMRSRVPYCGPEHKLRIHAPQRKYDKLRRNEFHIMSHGSVTSDEDVLCGLNEESDQLYEIVCDGSVSSNEAQMNEELALSTKYVQKKNEIMQSDGFGAYEKKNTYVSEIDSYHTYFDDGSADDESEFPLIPFSEDSYRIEKGVFAALENEDQSMQRRADLLMESTVENEEFMPKRLADTRAFFYEEMQSELTVDRIQNVLFDRNRRGSAYMAYEFVELDWNNSEMMEDLCV